MDDIPLYGSGDVLTFTTPLNEELVTLFEETLAQSSWGLGEDGESLYIRYEENLNPHKQLQQIIEQLVIPNGLVLNGEISLEEDSAYTERIFEWYMTIKDNVLMISNQLNYEENKVIATLEHPNFQNRKKEVIAQFLKFKGYPQLAQILLEIE